MRTNAQREVLRRLARGEKLCTPTPMACTDAAFERGGVVSDSDLETLLDDGMVSETIHAGSWWYSLTPAGRAALGEGREEDSHA